MSLRDMDIVFMKGRGLDEDFVKGAVTELLQALDFLHTEVQAVHTGKKLPYTLTILPTGSEAYAWCRRISWLRTEYLDVHPGNLLLGLTDDTVFRKLEDTEFSNPVPRKKLADRAIYLSRLMKPKPGPLLLSDFGETRLGPGPHAGDVMPIMYRAPETLLHVQWSYPVDIWSAGLTVG